MRRLSSRLMVMLVIILAIGALGYLSREVDSMKWIIENDIRMRKFVREYPWQGWILGFGIYTAFSMVPGTTGKSLVCGWLFGFWPAVMIVDLGLTVAAVCSFLAARFVFRDRVTARFQELIEKLDHHLAHDGAFYLLMMRLAHMPFTFVNYGSGATSVKLGTFTWTTAIGVLPGTMIFVFVGTRIPTLATLADEGIWRLLDPLFVGLLAASVAFPVLVRWAVRKYRTHQGSHPELTLAELEAVPE